MDSQQKVSREDVCMYDGYFEQLSWRRLQSAAMAVSLASSGQVRSEAVLHGYGTSPLQGGGVVLICDSAHSW